MRAVLIHGGFWRTPYGPDLMAPLAADLADRGWETTCIAYRRLGEGGGWPATFDDVRAVPQADVVIGHSAGGHLALWLAAEWRRCRLAVSLAGVVDLRAAHDQRLGNGAATELMGGSPHEVPHRYTAGSPRERLPLGVRQLLVHGAEDSTVPVAMSESYAAAAAEAGDEVEVVVVPGEGHFHPIDPASQCWAEVVARLPEP